MAQVISLNITEMTYFGVIRVQELKKKKIRSDQSEGFFQYFT